MQMNASSRIVRGFFSRVNILKVLNATKIAPLKVPLFCRQKVEAITIKYAYRNYEAFVTVKLIKLVRVYVCLCAPIYLSIYLSIYRSIDRSIDRSIYRSVHLSIDRAPCLNTVHCSLFCLSVGLSVSVCLSVLAL